MFDRFRKKSAALQLYGKLPIAKDYLRVGASTGPALALREWLDHSYSSQASTSGRGSLGWPMRFLLGAVQGDPLMGTLWPSTDLGGNRPFPFAAFIEQRRRSLAQAEEESFLRLPIQFQALEASYKDHASFGDGQEFLTAMRSVEVSLQAPLSPAPTRVEWNTWVRTIWPTIGQDGLVNTLLDLRALSQDRQPIRLPMVQGVEEISQLHAWWSALIAIGLIGGEEVPTCFWPAPGYSGDQPRFCTFMFTPLGNESAAWLAPADTHLSLGPGDFALNRPCALGQSGPTPENVPSLADSIRGPLATVRSRI